MHPIIADGGELTVLRSLAAFSYGKWDVTWPDSVPEDVRPSLADGREFGYAARLKAEPGSMGRRFVRSDVSIQAAEYGVDGKVIPFSGFSDAEDVLDAAATKTNGDVFFGREFTREHLGGLVPWVDFDVGDLVPVVHWGRSIVSVVTGIEAVTEHGAVVDWRVRVGDTLLRDDDARERNLRQLERDMAQEQRERREAVSEARSYADSAVSAERVERRADVGQVREVLGGARASEATLVSQLSAVQAQIRGMVGYGETPPPAGLLNSYLWTNTRLWRQQEEINRQNEEFKRITAELDAQQSEQIQQLAEVQKRLVKESQGRIRELMATPAGTSDPSIPATKRDDGKPGWQVRLTDMVAGGLFHVQWYKTAELDSDGGVRVSPSSELVRTLDEDLSWYRLSSSPDHSYMFARWASVTRKQVTVNASGGGWDVARSSWQRILTHPAPAKKASNVALRLKVTWAAATYDDTYKIRVRVGSRTLREYSTTGLGPLTVLGDGERWMSVMVSDTKLKPWEQIFVDVYSTATLSAGRRVKRAELTGTWIEEV